YDHHHHHHRVVRVEEDVLAKNSRIAERNRGWLAARRVLALNLVSSPGAGKTSLLERTLRESGFPATVIEGDQATERDADRIRACRCCTSPPSTARGWPPGTAGCGTSIRRLRCSSEETSTWRRRGKKAPRLSISSTLVRRASRGSVHNPVRKVGHPRPPTRRRYGDAFHGDREGQQGFGGGSSSRREDAERHGEVQRRAGEGGGDARRGGAAVELEGHAHPVLRRQADGDRRTLRGDEGARRGLLALASEVQGRGHRVAQ